MLDVIVIEELLRREREEDIRREQERPLLELPLPIPMDSPGREKSERPRGGTVIHIDILGED